MKPLFLFRRCVSVIVALSLFLSVGMFRQVSDASWYRFSQVTNQWMMAFSGLFGDSSMVNVVNAQQLNSTLANPRAWTPRSKKHRGLVGGWDMPFEMYQQRMSRVDFGGNLGIGTAYESLPVSIDINGDGLLDWVYSDVPSVFVQNGADYFTYAGGMIQYVILKRANGYELVYKCYQHVIDTNANLYEYYGDCADTNYQGGEPKYEVVWTPANMFLLESINWSNTSGRIVADEMGIDRGIYDIVYDQSVATSGVKIGDRHLPRFMDFNGDGLQDVVFTGQAEYGIQTPSHPSTVINGDLPFIMLNTGKGFELYASCINRQPVYPLLEHYNIGSNLLPRCF
ncbi:MAG: hypothetical protein P1V18_03885 [Candidatus Gracilibacteria bacterium]|nr:hypothetical protein [Candidatus Gracilibacteria bacterium]